VICADKEKAVAEIRKRLAVDQDAAVELADRAEESFLAETGRRSVPLRAFWLWVDLAEAIHLRDSGQSDQKVNAVKRGDTTINYGSDAARSSLSLAERMAFWRVAKAR
jgi:hypothetical protein